MSFFKRLSSNNIHWILPNNSSMRCWSLGNKITRLQYFPVSVFSYLATIITYKNNKINIFVSIELKTILKIYNLPLYFGLQTHRCCSWSHTPLLAVHLLGHIGMWQASPVNKASQVQTESIQIPFPEHSLEDVVLGHVFKLKYFKW